MISSTFIVNTAARITGQRVTVITLGLCGSTSVFGLTASRSTKGRNALISDGGGKDDEEEDKG